MNEKTRAELRSQLTVMMANNTNFLSMIAMPPVPVVGGIPPVPISVHPALMPYLMALKIHAEDFDRLLKLLDGVIAEL